jgi:hypothetical protein
MSIGGFANFNSADYTMVFMGILIDSGLQEEDFLSIEQTADDFTDEVGADGEVARARTNNATADIKLTLMQTSAGNTFLTALNNADKAAATNGTGVGPMLVRSRRSGTTVYTAAHCWIKKPPTVTVGSKTTKREWLLRCADLVRFDAAG